jgi:ubiquinone biosynthesis protein
LIFALARLGPTFIKFGQALSLRGDLLPEAYVVALQALQDRVAPFPAREAICKIEDGLRRSLNELFAQFDQKPLAAASIAQVHAARMRDGREVIVKVRRVGVKAQIDRAMRALRTLTRFAAALMPWLKRYQPLRIVDEVWKNLRREVDFRQEARNIRRFASAFADWPVIFVPNVIDDLSSENVIVQVRSGGRRIDDPSFQSEGPRLAQQLVEAYLHQILVLGFFDGDPRPGNLFITKAARICFQNLG